LVATIFGLRLLTPADRHPRMPVPDPVAPSAVPMKMLRWTQKAPRALRDDEIEDIVKRFGAASKVAQSAGFDGVEIHGAHGYLISEFLSPTVNQRRIAGEDRSKIGRASYSK
jgi:2,4-dienoyl-CoA reductase-like NADH-dependent reductase (Old Yellow Enzyme family)